MLHDFILYIVLCSSMHDRGISPHKIPLNSILFTSTLSSIHDGFCIFIKFSNILYYNVSYDLIYISYFKSSILLLVNISRRVNFLARCFLLDL